MAKYKVIGIPHEVEEDGELHTVYMPIECVSMAGLAKGKSFKWDPGSEITEKQVSDEEAKKLAEAGHIEVLEAPASWVENQG